MATKSSALNDLVQIVMLTFFLCALFFGGWGGYVMWTVKGLEEDRAREERSAKLLQAKFREVENVEAQREYLRREEAQGEGEGLQDSIMAVLAQLNDQDWLKTANNRSTAIDDKVVERSYSVDFKERPLRNYVSFLAMLEKLKPHVRVLDLDLFNKAKDGEEDSYSAKIVFIAYESAS